MMRYGIRADHYLHKYKYIHILKPYLGLNATKRDDEDGDGGGNEDAPHLHPHPS